MFQVTKTFSKGHAPPPWHRSASSSNLSHDQSRKVRSFLSEIDILINIARTSIGKKWCRGQYTFTLSPHRVFQSLLHFGIPQQSSLKKNLFFFVNSSLYCYFNLPVFLITRRFLPSFAIAIIWYVFQAADMLQIIVNIMMSLLGFIWLFLFIIVIFVFVISPFFAVIIAVISSSFFFEISFIFVATCALLNLKIYIMMLSLPLQRSLLPLQKYKNKQFWLALSCPIS